MSQESREIGYSIH